MTRIFDKSGKGWRSEGKKGSIFSPTRYRETLYYPSQWVTLETNGATFDPRLELVAGSTSTVWWEVNGALAKTGITPHFDFGSAATRVVRFGVTGTSGDALQDVQVINFGFDVSSDTGFYSIDPKYNHPSQQVRSIAGLTKCKNLKYFLSAHPVEYDNSSVGKVLAGAVDFSGLSKLEFIECYFSEISSVNLTGCTSLVRLTLEHNNLTSIDLNPVAGNLRDLRCAIQRTGVLNFTTLAQPLVSLYHFCVRDQVVGNFPAPDRLPNVNEFLVWNTGKSSLTIGSSQTRLVQCYLMPELTSLDIRNRFPAGADGVVQAFGCSLTTLDLTGNPGLHYLDLERNKFSQAGVDAILTAMDAFNSSGSRINLLQNPAPSAAGAAHVTALRSRGWTVDVSA